MFLFLVAVCIAALAALSLYDAKRKKIKLQFPPGPSGLPILGSALSLVGKVNYLKYMEWARTYGKIFMVKMLNTKVVVISDAKLAREAYNKVELLGKADVEPFGLYILGPEQYTRKPGVMFSEGESWSKQRRITLQLFKEFGLGKQAVLEGHINAEVQHLMSSLESSDGQALDPTMKFAEATSNVVWRMVAGERLDHTKEHRVLFQDSIHKTLDVLGSPIAPFMPSVLKFFAATSGWKDLHNLAGGIQTIIKDQVDKHWAQRLMRQSNPHDFMDSYIKCVGGGNDSSTHLTQLQAIAAELYMSGLEPTAVTLSWAVLLTTSSPEVHQRLERDILEVLGDNKMPTLEDKKKLPFLEAIIDETLRYSSIAPFGLMHRATADVVLSGYLIQKDTWIAVNQYNIHHDPEVWGDPQTFRPDRFLTTDSNGKSCLKHWEELLPFSVGKRMCFGDQMARNMIFLILARFYQQFHVGFDPSAPWPSFESKTHALKMPQSYKVMLERRQDNKL